MRILQLGPANLFVLRFLPKQTNAVLKVMCAIIATALAIGLLIALRSRAMQLREALAKGAETHVESLAKKKKNAMAM